MDTHHATLLLEETRNAILYNDTRNSLGLASNISKAVTKTTEMNVSKINAYAEGLNGIHSRTIIITNVREKNNTSVMSKPIIQMERRIFLRYLSCNFSY
jgi:hypothetical protein